jgi:hypothetical protein
MLDMLETMTVRPSGITMLRYIPWRRAVFAAEGSAHFYMILPCNLSFRPPISLQPITIYAFIYLPSIEYPSSIRSIVSLPGHHHSAQRLRPTTRLSTCASNNNSNSGVRLRTTFPQTSNAGSVVAAAQASHIQHLVEVDATSSSTTSTAATCPKSCPSHAVHQPISSTPASSITTFRLSA